MKHKKRACTRLRGCRPFFDSARRLVTEPRHDQCRWNLLLWEKNGVDDVNDAVAASNVGLQDA